MAKAKQAEIDYTTDDCDIELARRNLLDFITYTKGDYQTNLSVLVIREEDND